MGFIKRFLPFVVALGIGIFVASFFVELRKPTFRGHRGQRFHEMKRLRTENEALRNENLRLRNELDNHRLTHPHLVELEHKDEWPGTALDGLPPPPPVAPRAKR